MARCAGPRPTRPCGLRAAHPAHPVRRRCRRPPGLPAAVREMWRPRPRLRRVLVKLAASRCAGAPLRKARPRQAACGGPCFAPPPRRSRRRCSGAARPPQVGALGPSAPPARSAALRPALPARPRLRRRPCRAALPTHSPPGVAGPRPSPLSAAKPGRALRPAALPLRGARNLYRRAHWRRKRRLPRASRAAGRRRTPPAGGSAGRCPGRQGQGKPRAGRQAAHKRGPCLPVPRPAMGKRGGCPALCGPPAPSHSGKTVVLLCRMLSLVVSLLLAGSGGWSAVLVVSLAGLFPGLPGLSGRPRWRRLLPVSWRRLLLPAPSGLLVLLSVGWRLCGAGNSRALGAVFAADLGRSGPDRRQV